MSDMNICDRLSFADASKRDLWALEASGDYAADCETGEEAGRELADYMRSEGAPMVLGHVLRAMVARGQFSGVEVGFAHSIASAIGQTA